MQAGVKWPDKMGMLTHLLITNSNTGILWQLLFALSFGDCQCELYRGERGDSTCKIARTHLPAHTHEIYDIFLGTTTSYFFFLKSKYIWSLQSYWNLQTGTELLCFFPPFFLKQSSAHPGYTAVERSNHINVAITQIYTVSNHCEMLPKDSGDGRFGFVLLHLTKPP